MKKVIFLVAALALVLIIGGCAATETIASVDLSAGQYVGYSWRGEANGTALEDADQYIETILKIDENGIITDAKMRFFAQRDGYWTMRQSGNAYVDVDFSVDLKAAEPGENYSAGNSMFTVVTADMMSFYAAAVNSQGVTAAVIVDPVTRYMYEMKFPQDFDFETTVDEMTIGNSLIVPTTRVSGSGILKPEEWESLADKNIFNIDVWSHVLTARGTFEGLSVSSTVQKLLEAMGVEFDGGKPQPMDVVYGYHSTGGWNGNLNAIAEYLIGQDATQKTSLVDWSGFEGSINDKNQFGVDVESGATRTVQNSFDTISGATIRISRESTSYQRALVAAGIIGESEVIIGRF